MLFNIPCIILAGGKSSRMGEDKALLPFSSFNTLTQFQLSRLEKIFTSVYISCRDKSKFDFEANFIEDIDNDEIFAPTKAFVSIMEYLDVERFFIISVDTPFVGADEIKVLLQNDANMYDATVATLEGKVEPLVGIYHSSLKNRFQKMQQHNNHKLGYLLNSAKTNYVNFSNEKAFLNLNHPHEYKNALGLI